MENSFLSNKQVLKNDETQGKIIRLFPNTNISDDDLHNESEEEKLTITIPRGYNAKVIFEKKEESNNTSRITTPIREVNSDLDKIEKNNLLKELAITSTYDIMKLQTGIGLISNLKGYNINEEDINMKKSLMYDIIKDQIKFFIVAVGLIVISLIGIIIFNRTGFYVIHPLIYIITLLMGIGWGATALASIKNNEV